jgi:hypothetical protein
MYSSSKGLLPDIKHWQKFFLFFIIFFHDAWQMSQGAKKKRKNKRSKGVSKYETPASLAERNILLHTLNFQVAPYKNVKDSNGLERH